MSGCRSRFLFSPLAFIFLSLCLLARVGIAQSNLVLLASQPGDWIGQGNVYSTTNPANFSFSGNPTFIGISAFEPAPPTSGEPLSAWHSYASELSLEHRMS
jgi:hypothetical protein